MPRKTNKEKLKIGVLSFYYPHLGGSGIVSTRIAEYLAKKGHEVHFIGYDSDTNPENMEKLGIQLHKVKPIDYPCLKNEPYSWTLGSKICQVDKEHDLDLIHANYTIPHALSAFIARESRKMEGKYLPYVVTGHGSDIHTNGAKDEVNPILQLTLNQADGLTYVSEDLKKIAEEQLGIIQKGIVIPNFVDTEIFRKSSNNLRTKLGIPENSFVVGHISNFAPIKQTNHFFELARYMKGENTLHNVYFLMLGDGKEKAELQEKINKAELGEHFIFRGKQELEEVVRSYNIMDTVLLPSKHEGNPLTLLEAMACEVPVIGARVGGITETVEGGGGFLFENGNIPELAKIVSNLKTDRKMAREVGREGLKKINEKYSIDNIMEEYFKIFNRVKRQ